MRGWDPERQAREERIEVVETTELPGRVQAAVDHERRIIWVAAGLTAVQRRSSVAYELGEMHQGPTPDDPCLAAAYRRAAEEWAALMLIPTEDFTAAFVGCLDLPAMAARCGVDLPTFRARIRAASDADQDAVMQAIGQTRLAA